MSWLKKEAAETAKRLCFPVCSNEITEADIEPEIERVARAFAERALRLTMQPEYDVDTGKMTVHPCFPDGDSTVSCGGNIGRFEARHEAQMHIDRIITETLKAADKDEP